MADPEITDLISPALDSNHVARIGVVGMPHPGVDARAKAVGRLEYITDMRLPKMLEGKILRSPHPHARILNVDTQRATRLPGVRAVITSKDTPRLLYGPMIADQYPLAVDRVRYVGDAVAAVAAIDTYTATEALSLIDVDYEILPPVFDPMEAILPGAPQLHDVKTRNIALTAGWQRGEVDEAFRASDVILEQRFQTQLVHQCYMEPMAAIAAWDTHGRLTLWLPIQVPGLAQWNYAAALGLAPGRVRVVQTEMGGAFGGKLEHSFHLVCALLSQAAGLPVRIAYTREEEFEAGLPRVPFVIDLRVGAKRDGTLMAKQADLFADNGAYTSYGPAILSAAATRSDCLYRLNNVRTSMTLVYTNKVPTGCFRGFGNLQMHFANESMMDMLAYELGVDPLDFRLKNATHAGDVTVHGFQIGSCGLSECLKQAAELSRWRETRSNPRRLHGIGVAAAIHVSSNRSFVPEFDGSAAIIRIGADGKATVLTGEVDMGQGSKTVFAQIAAEELGLTLNDISVPNADTDLSPFGLGTWGSRATTLGGNAVKAAAEDARRKLLTAATELLDARPGTLVIEGGFVRAPDGARASFADVAKHFAYRNGGAPILGQGHFVPPGVVPSDPRTKFGNVSCAYPFGVHVAEVEVNIDTGQVRVVRIVAAHDVGKVVNPLGAEGQVEGGIAQGMGFALMEEMQVISGKPANPNFRDYKIPSTMDMPEIECSFIESQDPHGPYGAKGLAEPAIIPTPPAIANALFDALKIRFTELPITPQKVLMAIQQTKAHEASSYRGGEASG